MQPKIKNATLQPDATRIKNCVIIQKSQYGNRHTDFFLLVSVGIRKAVKKTARWTIFNPWENPIICGCIPEGCRHRHSASLPAAI